MFQYGASAKVHCAEIMSFVSLPVLLFFIIRISLDTMMYGDCRSVSVLKIDVSVLESDYFLF